MRPLSLSRVWRLALSLPLIAGVSALAACDDLPAEDGPAGLSVDEAPLTDLEALLEGAPDPDKLPDEPKADQSYPKQFDLFDWQSPVRNQQSRGVCSIFSTVALMEHLYIKEGSIPNPNFSEQFLQWNSKVELGAFTHTEGSNATRNLEAISRFGIVTEADWPYEGRAWSTTNDARCTGDDRPVVCYTNGDPSDEVRTQSRRYKLPPGRWVSRRVNSIKAFMFNNKQAVVAGMTFFYQSWNHRGGSLPVNSDYLAEGYVLYPNEEDKQVAKDKPAGHSILIVGWDDELSVQTVDKDGNKVVDESGEPVMETGFFLIKNSWGTGSYGTRNPFGAGYGWLSMRYVDDYANIMGANVPSVNLGPEVCDDGVDNNYNGLTDCEDTTACGGFAGCNTADRVFEARPNAAIPDNNEAGFTSTLQVDATGYATSAYVDVRITHSFVRDLRVTLTSPGGRVVVLYDRDRPSGRDIIRRFNVAALVGEDVQGPWSLNVADLSSGDTGRLVEWKLGLGLSGGVSEEICDDGIDNTGDGLTDCASPDCAAHEACQAANPGSLIAMSDEVIAIPDNDATGIRSAITLSGPGLVNGVEVDVDIRHTYRGDLTVRLIHPDGSMATLIDREGGATPNIDQSFQTNAFNGKKAEGTWTLWVVDGLSGDVGTLNAWLLDVTTR